MNTTLQYAFNLNGSEQNVTITNDTKIQSDEFVLSKGELLLGDMKFEQDYWIYNGLCEFTRDELIAIADFIKVNQESYLPHSNN
ncbi:hypothetical protein [Mucilaginibacter sp.]